MANERGKPKNAQAEQMSQFLNEMKAAADMMRTMAAESNDMIDKMTRSSTSAFDSLQAFFIEEYAPGYAPGARAGSSSTSGRAPKAQDNQSRRPQHYPGQYPGVPGRLNVPSQLSPRQLDQVNSMVSPSSGGGGLAALRQRTNQAMAQMIHRTMGHGREGTYLPSQVDAKGQVTHWASFGAQGEKLGEHEASEVLPGMSRSIGSEMASRGAASGMAGAIGEGGLGAGLRAMPMVGVAGGLIAGGAEAVWKGANFVANQRQANSQYQSILGGSNMAGLGQRAQAAGFGISSVFTGGLGYGASQEAFKDVTSLGYQGGARSQSLGFIESNYKTMGMSVKDSMQLVAIASKNANTNLMDLEKQLRAVSDQAKDTGQSASAMRSSFVQNYAQTQQAGLGAQSSGMLAQSQTMVTGGLGRQYGGINLGGLNSPTGMTMAAAAQGMTYTQYLGATQNNPMLAAQGQQTLINRAFDASIGEQGKQALQQLIQKRGGNQAVVNSPGLQQSIAAEALQNGAISNMQALMSTLAGYGIDTSQINPLNVAAWAVAWAAGGVDVAKQTAAQVSQTQQRSTGDLAQGKGMPAGMSQHGTNVLQTRAQQAQSSAKYGNVGGLNNPGPAFDTKTGEYDPVIDQMMKKYGGDLKLGVQTSDGYREVSLTEAAKNYRDQLINGTATIVDSKRAGDDRGKQLKDIFGTEQGAKTTDTTGKAATVGKKDQKDLQNLGLETGGGKSGSAQVGVYIDMTPELKKYLNITTTGSPIVENGAANNLPPAVGR